MYADLLKRKFPQDEKNGFYKVPQLPATRLGKVLLKFTQIASPADVVAMHYYAGTFSSGVALFTSDKCFYDEGAFLLEDIREVQHKGSKLVVFVNQQTQFIPHKLSAKNDQAAETLKRILDALVYYDPQAEARESYEGQGYNQAEIDWLKLRDEVLRTVDLLYERYNDGKLSILEYEEKKQALLDRL